MPLTEKGKKIIKEMKDKYGAKRGESVFYASARAGKITGVEGKSRGKNKKPSKRSR